MSEACCVWDCVPTDRSDPEEVMIQCVQLPQLLLTDCHSAAHLFKFCPCFFLFCKSSPCSYSPLPHSFVYLASPSCSHCPPSQLQLINYIMPTVFKQAYPSTSCQIHVGVHAGHTLVLQPPAGILSFPYGLSSYICSVECWLLF